MPRRTARKVGRVPMRIGGGDHVFEWIDNWARIPESPSADVGWAHPGMATTAAGELITCHPSEPTIVIFDRGGVLVRALKTTLTEAHGITLVTEDATEYLWVADPGSKRRRELGYEYGTVPQKGQAVKMTLDGQAVASIERPDLPIYQTG